MEIRVKNGTPIHGPSLCDTCSRAHIERGYSASEKVVICRAVDPAHEIKFPVRDCTDYIDRTRQTLWQMEQMAWVLTPRGPKRKAGFSPPAKRQEREEHIELIFDSES
ncbi:MAG TPA: hypothetical protein VEJ67_05585 [Candidatus Cybelea sp.]|nr:hypothetical protein [Candidatus Cybelea sp.]